MPYRHRGPGRARRHRTPSEAFGALLSRPSSGNDPIEWDVAVSTEKVGYENYKLTPQKLLVRWGLLAPATPRRETVASANERR